MSLDVEKRTIEVETLVGTRSAQALLRAEALVPGAGRDAIVPLLADASVILGEVDLQKDRLVIEGTLSCQGVYRQGEETTLRALAVQTSFSQVLEIVGTESGLFSRVDASAEHVEARYENGHMIFQVTVRLNAQVLKLSPVEVIVGLSASEDIQTAYRELTSVKLAAESTEAALIKQSVPIPAALDARMTLMDRAVAEVDEVAADLGGMRVKGRVLVETLLSSGVAGQPAALVRFPMPLDQLVELPDWLTGDVAAEAEVRAVHSTLEGGGDGGELELKCEAEVRVKVYANARDEVRVLTDAYAVRGPSLEVSRGTLGFCSTDLRARQDETVRGTVLLEERAPAVGAVIAALLMPVIGQWRDGRIEGICEGTVLYMPVGGTAPVSAAMELPFSLPAPVTMEADSLLRVRVLGTEASALMSDRLEVRAQLSVACETRRREAIDIAEAVGEGEDVVRHSGIVICWPEAGEDAWTIGKRYAVPSERAASAEAGKALVLRL